MLRSSLVGCAFSLLVVGCAPDWTPKHDAGAGNAEADAGSRPEGEVRADGGSGTKRDAGASHESGHDDTDPDTQPDDGDPNEGSGDAATPTHDPMSCTTEVCDHADNDCDGDVDEGDVCATAQPETIAQIAVGQSHACALLGSGAVKCWGSNTTGQLGDGTKNSSSKPVAVADLGEVKQVAASGQTTCALRADGKVYCWGRNDYYQFGIAGNDSPMPQWVEGVSDATQISLGSKACALRKDGTVICWGAKASEPKAVAGLTNVTQVSAGYDHACAVTSAGRALCWGTNDLGQVTGTVTDPVTTPVDVGAAQKVDAGPQSTCILLANGSVSCWGLNTGGWLGYVPGQSGLVVSAPVTIAGVTDATDVAIMGVGACATLSNRTVECWGPPYDDAGYSVSDEYRDHPAALVPGVQDVLELAAGGYACARVSGGTVACWGGSNTYGEWGNGTTRPSPSPGTVIDLP